MVGGTSDVVRGCCGSWTPDGRYYLFEGWEKGSREISRHDIWVIRERSGPFRAGKAQPMRLTNGPIGFSSPISSKDGKRVLRGG